MNPFWNTRYRQALQEAAESKRVASNADMSVQELKWQVDKLTLINRAFFELLHEKLGMTEAELMAKMHEIDMRDSHLNGQGPASAPVSCEACGKTYSKRHNHRLYCGHVNQSGSPF